jgi:protein-tyrosine phosphatase
VIDIHTHLLPGVDDGSPNIDVTLQVLERFAHEGVERVVCTPHLRASQAADAPVARHRELLSEIETRARSLGVECPALSPGWEIMLDRPGCDLRARWLALGESRAVLVELPRQFIPPETATELARLRASGIVPVLAHPERYRGVTTDAVREWRAAGAVIQTDATALLAGGPMTEMSRAMLAEGLVDALASDNHGDRRSLGACRLWLEEQGAAEQAELLTRTNPARVLADEAPFPVPPIALDRGVLRRLRQMVFGK